MIDTHCHLYTEAFTADLDAVIVRARDAGLERIYLPAIDRETHAALLALVQQAPGFCYPMMGLHPCSVKSDFATELALIREYIDAQAFAAIGEIGLDFYWDKTHLNEQYEALHQQINWALEKQWPVVLHTRDAIPETIEVIREYQHKGLKGIFHCFGGTKADAEAIIELGFYLGIGGVITYKKSGLKELVADLPLDRLVLETDAPYLSPTPFRGKRNEPAYLKIIAAEIANAQQIPVESVWEATTRNALDVFQL
jgi:TatD DNase family protein